MGGHGTTYPLSSPRVALEEDAQRRAHPRDRLPAAARGRPRAERARAAGAPATGSIEAPVFVICTLRSGSTLLRVLLDSHSQIRSPHELHLRYVSVHFDQKWSERSMKELGLDTARRRVPAVGPPPAPRAHRQRQVDHRRQDAQQRLHRRPPARGVAGRALHLPAPPPGRDRPLARRRTRASEGARRADHPLRRGARGRAADLRRPHRPLRGPDRRTPSASCARSATSSACPTRRRCSTTASSTTAATSPASATGTRRSSPAPSSRPSRLRRSRRSTPRCARCARSGVT